MDAQLAAGGIQTRALMQSFSEKLASELTASASDSEVAGFKSIACYRTGLDVAVNPEWADIEVCLVTAALRYESTMRLRLSDKALNDFIVNTTMRIAGEFEKPGSLYVLFLICISSDCAAVQFHTGLGDNDITLAKSSPSHMQPLIKAYPMTPIVLLHSSYPYTQEAGYLAAVYRNVYLDFGEVFPFVSAEGQRQIVRQVLELCPTNKIMWSSEWYSVVRTETTSVEPIIVS